MKTMNNTKARTLKKTEQKTARKENRFDRVLHSGAGYMANYAVVRGGLPSFNSGSFLM